MTEKQIAEVFDEWARQYADNPAKFDSILDASGKPVENYGPRCAVVFLAIAKTLGIQWS